MINIFACLLLGHVVSDFVLQSNFIYKLKTKSKYGIYLHVGMFTVLSFLLCMPFSLNIKFIVWLLIVSVSHYFIDKIKLFFQRNIIQKELLHFFIDQSLHVLMLCSFLLFFRSDLGRSIFYDMVNFIIGKTDTSSLLFLFKVSFSVYVAYGISVILYYYDRTVDLKVESLKHDYFSMLIRVCIFILCVSRFFLIGIFAILILRHVLRKTLIYDSRRFFIEILTLLILVLLFMPIRILLEGGLFL